MNRLKPFIVVPVLLSLILLHAQVHSAGLKNEQASYTQKIYSTDAVTTEETARCLACHSKRQRRLVETWEGSTHARNGVGCYECHMASDSHDPAARNGHFSFSVQLPVSPLRCAECHPAEYASFASSTHIMAFDRIKDQPIRKTSPMVFEQSCASCHGNDLRMKRGKPVDNTWPNHGIGRINTDGSRGSCAACHGHHDDSMARVRSAETCGVCHFDSPWHGSKHASNWHQSSAGADLDKTAFEPAEEMLKRPDCYTCHLAPTIDTATSTHNPGERLSWYLAEVRSTHRLDWGKKRLAMTESCRLCHAPTQIDMFYRRFDAAVLELNKTYDFIIEKGDLSESRFLELKKNLLDAKTGAAMQSPQHINKAAEKLSGFL